MQRKWYISFVFVGKIVNLEYYIWMKIRDKLLYYSSIHIIRKSFYMYGEVFYSFLCNQHMHLVPNLILSKVICVFKNLKFRWDLNQDFRDSWQRASTPTQYIGKLQILQLTFQIVCHFWLKSSNRVFHFTKPFFVFNWIPSDQIIITPSACLRVRER